MTDVKSYNKPLTWIFVAILAIGSYSYLKLPQSPEKKPDVKVTDTKTEEASAVITDGSGSNPITEVEVGESLILRSDKSVAGTDKKSINWLVDPPERMARMATLENGRTISIPVGKKPGTLKITLLCAKGDSVSFKTVIFKVLDSDAVAPAPVVRPVPVPQPVAPQPIPTPVVRPEPVVQPVEISLSPLDTFRAKVGKIVLPKATKDEIRTVAQAYRQVAVQISDGTITETRSMINNTSTELQSSLGLNTFLLWVPWRDSMLSELEAAKVPTFKDHAKYWNVVAEVLDKQAG